MKIDQYEMLACIPILLLTLLSQNIISSRIKQGTKYLYLNKQINRTTKNFMNLFWSCVNIKHIFSGH